MSSAFITEPSRELPVHSTHDVVVCGGGPAGIAAAIAAARSGADTCLIENHGYLGGVWTAGLLSLILDSRNKPGLIVEIRERLAERGAIRANHDLYDAEEMKVLLEEMGQEAGVTLRLYTRLAGAQVKDRNLTHVILEAKEGRFAVAARAFVDATGDGDLAARAGCGFDFGRPQDGLTQPMTLMAIVSGVPFEVRESAQPGSTCLPKDDFREMLERSGCFPSYARPSLFPLPNGRCCLMVNHEYERNGLDSLDLTAASIQARAEIRRVVRTLNGWPGWESVGVTATAPSIGVREARRIHGRYQVTLADMLAGIRHADAITRVHFAIDVHSVKASEGGGYGADNVRTPIRPYDIPLRALIAADRDNLALAGRCISGDFHAHASYRVTGNAVATGEAAGVAAAVAAAGDGFLAKVSVPEVLSRLAELRRAEKADRRIIPA